MTLISNLSLTPTVNNITPFTIRDGATYLEILEAIREYVIQLGAETQASVDFWHGDPRYQRLIMEAVTTSSGAAFMLQDDGTRGVVIPDFTTQSFLINLVARRVDGSTTESAGYFLQGVIDRGNGKATTAMVGSFGVTAFEDMSAWAVDITANPTTGSLDIAVLGENAKTISWVCAIQMTSVTV